MLGEHPYQLLDVARVATEHERRQVLDRTGDRARLPLERRLAPAVETRLIGTDLDEHPVPHSSVDDERSNTRDPHGRSLNLS